MIETVIHCGDVHIHKDTRLEEYRLVFDTFYNKLREIKPDRIVVNGDTWNDWVELKSDGFLLLGEFLNKLSHISKVIITLGNHDFTRKNLNKTDTIKAVTTLLDNNNITYYDKTGFYNDENVVWSVWGHADRGNPWRDFPIVKDKTKTYIDLYHDPIDNVKLYNGIIYTKNNIPSIKDLKGDISMLNDIHLFQSFENGTKAYSSSLIQQNFGEDLTYHGALQWSISNKKFEFIDIPNDHGFINLYIDETTDYNNLNLSSNIIFKDSEIKVHWKDYSSNITVFNEKKIRDYIKDNFNTIKIKFEKTFIYTDVISSEMLSESLDLTDLTIQTNIFKEYLQEQKYKKDDIEEILKIDEIINSRLNLSNNKTNIEWSIDKFWFSNFKSYGDDNEIDWKDIDGIIQISATENQEGKTSILDAITYILYGKTTTTLSPEKFGDSRFINNKRNLDYCLGGVVIDVNGEKFTIQRKTERIWNRNKTSITSCPTTIEYYKDEILDEKNKLTGEAKKKTQDKLDLILGDIKDFIRLSFTNADNLNDLLSETRSVFIDCIIKDAGLDIFETKLEEFKEYKKELSEEKLIVDIQDSESQILDFKIEITGSKEEIKSNQVQIDEFEIELKRHGVDRDDLNKKLSNIDSSMINFDETINLNSIKNYEIKINESKIQSTILDREINILPQTFDINKINNLKIKLKETQDKISERKDEISKIRGIMIESDNKKDKILAKIKELKESEIKKMQLKISDNDLNIEIIKSKKENVLNEEIKEITFLIQKLELEKNDISNKMKLLQKDGSNLKNSNDELEKEIEKLKESTTCPECGKKYDINNPNDAEHLKHLNEKIEQKSIKKDDNSSKIQKFLSDYKLLKNKLPELEEKENELNIQKSNLKSGIFSDEIRLKLKYVGSAKNIKQENLDIKIIIDEIKNNNFEKTTSLKDNIAKGTQLLKNVEKEKNDNIQFILNIESELKNFDKEGIENDIDIEEKIRSNFELRKQKISQADNIILTIENFDLKIKDLKYEFDKYQEHKLQIEENKNIQFSIDRIDEKILIVKDSIKELQDENSDIEKDIIINEKEIETITNKITKYLKQKKKEELLKEYQKCISRDGIPTFLLKKSIHLINRELNEILTNVDFTLFFDENLILKMSADDRLDVSQNAIESSGKERTFCALALKMALREVNVKSKPKFIFLDELTGKLTGKSIQQFVDFIEGLKTKIKKIVIIEHHNYINFDAIISVKKDEKLKNGNNKNN